MSTHCYCNDSPFSKARIDHSRKIGHFVRKSDRQKVQRYQCKVCGKSFSSAIFSEFRYFNYRHLKSRIIKHFSYCGSLRTAKVLLGIDKDTAARYLHKLSGLIEKKNHELIKSQGKFSVVPKTSNLYEERQLYDTSQKGMGNTGHSRMFENLSDDDRLDLLEYLKTL